MIRNDIFIYVNRKFAEIFGYSVEECLDNMRFATLVHPDDLATVEEQVGKRASGEKETAQYTFRGVRKDGEIVHVEIFGSSIILKGNSVVTGTVMNISERKQNEEALRKSEQKYRQLIDNTPEGIVVAQDGIIQFANNAFIEIAGFSSDELIGKPIFDAIHLDDRHTVLQRHLQRIAGGRPPLHL